MGWFQLNWFGVSKPNRQVVIGLGVSKPGFGNWFGIDRAQAEQNQAQALNELP